MTGGVIDHADTTCHHAHAFVAVLLGLRRSTDGRSGHQASAVRRPAARRPHLRPPPLAAETATSERGVRALLNALTGIELLSKDGEGRYSLTAESALFLVSTK